MQKMIDLALLPFRIAYLVVLVAWMSVVAGIQAWQMDAKAHRTNVRLK